MFLKLSPLTSLASPSSAQNTVRLLNKRGEQNNIFRTTPPRDTDSLVTYEKHNP